MTVLPGADQVEMPWAPSPGPAATAGELLRSAFEGQMALRNHFWIETAREEAYDRHAAAVREATGVDLGNPLRAKREQLGAKRPVGKLLYYAFGLGQMFEDPEEDYQRRLIELAQQRPELADVLRADRRPDFEVRARAAEADRVQRDVALRRGGQPSALTDVPVVGAFTDATKMLLTDPFGFVSQAAGSFGGMMMDPANAATMFVGPLRSVGLGLRPVLWSGVKNGVANAVVEGLQAPATQAWRRAAGLDYGLGEATKDIEGALAAGFLLDVGGRSAYRGVRRLQGRSPLLDAEGGVMRWQKPDAPDAPLVAPGDSPSGSRPPGARPPRDPDPEVRLEEAAREMPPDSLPRRALQGDMAALEQLARETVPADEPAVRGALAELDHFKRWGEAPEVDRWDHLERLSDALARAQDPRQPPLSSVGVPDSPSASRPGTPSGAHGDVPDVLPMQVLSPEAEAARVRLVDGDGGPVELALLMREHPNAVEGIRLSDTKQRQALAIAGLEEGAFRRVLAGEVAPNHAALIGRHAGDHPGLHGAIVDDMARMRPRNENEARLLIGEHVNGAAAGKPGPAREVLGGVTARELAPDRARVLAAGLKTVAKDGRFRAAIEAWMPQVAGDAKLTKAASSRLGQVIEALARADSEVGRLLDDAALAMRGGISHKQASAAFVDRLASIIERDGIAGLAGRETPAEPAGLRIDDPAGPEAKAQADSLARRIKFSNPGEGDNGRGSRSARGTSRGDGQAPGQGRTGAGGLGTGGQSGPAERARQGFLARARGRDGGTFERRAEAGGHVVSVFTERGADGLERRTYWLHREGAAGPSETASPRVSAHMHDQLATWLSRVELNEREPGRWEVAYVQTRMGQRKSGNATRLYDAIERHLGQPLIPSGQLTPQGMALWRKRRPEWVEHHRYIAAQDLYFSPREMTERLRLLDAYRQLPDLNRAEREMNRAETQDITKALKTVPKAALKRAALAERWSMPWAPDLRPAAAADWPAIRADVDRVINRLPPGIRGEVRERIVFGGRDRDGFWDPHERLIAIALNERAGSTVRHEELHVLKSLSLIRDDEWAVLVEYARRHNLAEAYDVEGRWGDEMARAFGDDEVRLREALLEETVAEMMGLHRFGARFGGVIDQVFARVTEFIERLGNALAGRGFQSAHDVFRRIDSGEVGRRRVGLNIDALLGARLDSSIAAPREVFNHIEDIGPNDPHPGGTIRAYHGGPAPIVGKFNPNLGEGLGPHFGTVQQANKIAHSKSAFRDQATAQVGVYDLKFKRVLDIPDLQDWDPGSLLTHLQDVDAVLARDLDAIDLKYEKRMAEGGSWQDTMAEIRQALVKNGIDALRYPNQFEGGGWSYVALAQGTVRSATDGGSVKFQQQDRPSGRPAPPGWRPRAELRAFERSPLPASVAAWLGAERGTIYINVAHILRSRAEKGSNVPLDTPARVQAFVNETLANADWAMQYKAGDWTYNFVRVMPDGSGHLVAMDVVPNQHGHFVVRTAFDMTKQGLQRKIRGTATSLGRDGFQIMPGSREAHGKLFANVSEAHTAAPGTSTDMLMERLRQEQRLRDEAAATDDAPAVDEPADALQQRQRAEADAALLDEIERTMSNPAARENLNAETVRDLGHLAEACKL